MPAALCAVESSFVTPLPREGFADSLATPPRYAPGFMAIFAKLGMSLLILFVCAALIYPTAYAFAVDEALRTRLQYVQMFLALGSVVCLWLGYTRATTAAVAAVILITTILLLLNR